VVGTGSYDAATDTLRVSPVCIANNGSNGEPEVPLWHCPCRDCTKMEWEVQYEEGQTLAEHRHENFPEYW
jgi:hypothetical protein